MSTRPGTQVRVVAARVIMAIRFEGRSLKAVLPDAVAGLADARDRALCEAIVFAATRWLWRYEFWLAQLLERPLPKAARPIHAVLLAGLAQLDALALAEHAALAATAEAARELRQPRMVGLVNAVLRRFLRERTALDALAHADVVASSAHPRWLIEALQRDWPGQAETILAQNNLQAPMWLRVNLARHSRDACRTRLAAAGIQSEPDALAPAALRLEHSLSPTRLPGFSEGELSVQDVSAQLAVPLLQAREGERVLDIGAAPGGKTAHLLETVPGARVTALDIDAARLARIEATLARIGASASCIVGDATRPQTWWDGQPFDRILLDAPCSATGVIRRQPDIKLHRRAEDIPALVARQATLLDAAWPMLRPGGRLVYATCSVLRAENDGQIDAFLARTPTARTIAAPAGLGLSVGSGVQRFAQAGGGDGFFLALLEKDAASASAAGAGRL